MPAETADRARELEVFCAVIDGGSFSAAGRKLGLTPSAISRTLDRIEARLGARLLLRTTRVLTLTAEGRAYLAAAHRILADLDEAEQAISDQGAPRGRIRVSAAIAHGRLCVVPLLGEFVRRYPNIVVDINLTDRVVDVAAGQADVAVRRGPLADSALTARRLDEHGLTVVASPDYLARRGVPRLPEDLSQHICLNFSSRQVEPMWPFRRDGADYALKVHSAMEANNGDTLVQLAQDGIGIARASNFALGDALSHKRLVPLLQAFNPGDKEIFHAVFVGGASMPARIRVFVDYLVERMGEGAGKAARRRAPSD